MRNHILALLSCLPLSGLAAQVTGPRFINPPSLTKPTGYTHVVVAPDGRTVYIGGQVSFDSTGQVIGSGVRALTDAARGPSAPKAFEQAMSRDAITDP